MEFDLEEQQPAVEQTKGKDDTVTMTRAEADGLRRDRDEARESEKYWAGVARNGRQATAEPAEEQNDDPDASEFVDEQAEGDLEGDTPEKMVDELAAKGVGALKSRGFITAADAQKMAAEIAIKVANDIVNRREGKYRSDNTIMSAYPELKDKDSDLFKATAKIYQEAVAMDPSAKKTPAALFLAAKAAKASLKAAPKPRDEEDDDYRPERESDRRRRADSQDGRPRGRGAVEDRDDMLGDEARQVIKDMGISEEEYRAGQKATQGSGRRR